MGYLLANLDVFVCTSSQNLISDLHIENVSTIEPKLHQFGHCCQITVFKFPDTDFGLVPGGEMYENVKYFAHSKSI